MANNTARKVARRTPARPVPTRLGACARCGATIPIGDETPEERCCMACAIAHSAVAEIKRANTLGAGEHFGFRSIGGGWGQLFIVSPKSAAYWRPYFDEGARVERRTATTMATALGVALEEV